MSETAVVSLDADTMAKQDAWAPVVLRAQVDLEKQRREIMLDYFRSCMREGHHYYRLPGQEDRKPALSKEGALNICSLYKVIPVPDEPLETWHDDGHYTVRYRTRIVTLAAGQLVAVGDGICSTRESKYAYRQASKLCPVCGKPAIIKGRDDYGGGWLCFRRIHGCGAKFPDGDAAIEQQPSGRVPNEDVADQYNTVLKMSEKRSGVDAVLKLPLVSELFTQDLEESIEGVERQRGSMTTRAPGTADVKPQTAATPTPQREPGTISTAGTASPPQTKSAGGGNIPKASAEEVAQVLELLHNAYHDAATVEGRLRDVLQIPSGQECSPARIKFTMTRDHVRQLEDEAVAYALQHADDDVPLTAGPKTSTLPQDDIAAVGQEGERHEEPACPIEDGRTVDGQDAVPERPDPIAREEWYLLSKRALAAGLSPTTWETLRAGDYEAAVDTVGALEDAKGATV